MRLLLACLLLTGVAFADAPSNVQAAKARFRQGKAFHELGAYDQAIVEFEAAYALAPLPELVFNIARAQQQKGENDKALGTYRRYLDLDPDGRVADEARRQVALLVLAQAAKPPVVVTEQPPLVVVAPPAATPRRSHKKAYIAVGVIAGVVVVGVAVGLGVGLTATTKGPFDSAVLFPPVK